MTTKMKKIRYSNDEITVIWQPELCEHYGICFSQLPEVFNPKITKWINPYNASSERIIEQVGRCPTGALSYIKRENNNNS